MSIAGDISFLTAHTLGAGICFLLRFIDEHHDSMNFLVRLSFPLALTSVSWQLNGWPFSTSDDLSLVPIEFTTISSLCTEGSECWTCRFTAS